MTTSSTIQGALECTAVRSHPMRNSFPAIDTDLERAVRRVVRRVIRRGEAESLVGERVKATAESLIRQSSMLRVDRDRLVARVARRLRELLDHQARRELDHLLGRRISGSQHS